MTNPIKNLIQTPLSMDVISDFNALSKIPLAIFRLFIGTNLVICLDCAICSKPYFLSQCDEYLLASILKR